jgi:hypothetical protein
MYAEQFDRRLAGMRFHDVAELIAHKRVCEAPCRGYFGGAPCACNRDARAGCEVMILQCVRARRMMIDAVGERLLCHFLEGVEVSTMPQTKQKHLKKAVPVAGVVGMSMAMTGGASATGAVGPTPDVQLQDTPPQFTLNEEEMFDVSLGAFFVFDKEVNVPGQQYAQRGCRGCGRGCAARGCARGCRGCGGCRGCSVGGCRACAACAGCGGCSCGCCVSWGACRFIC